MKRAISRRRLLAGTAAVTATALVGADTSAEAPRSGVAAPDTELAGLERTFAQALAAHEAARRQFNRCEGRFFDLCPCIPDELTGDGPLGRLPSWQHWSAAELRRILKNPKRRAVWKEAKATLALAKKYEAGVRRTERDSGLIGAEVELNAAIEHTADVSQLVLDVPARSFAGLAVKARVVKAWGRPEWWDPVEGRADTYERLAAQILDAVIIVAETGNAAGEARIARMECSESGTTLAV